MEQLEDQWNALCSAYCPDNKVVRECWQQIEDAYRARRRYYHNLQHLRQLLAQADRYLSLLQDYDGIRFSIFYHDIIYSSLRKDNELRSAVLAGKMLDKIGFPTLRANRVLRQIRATQQHTIPGGPADPDLPYFLDFDLAILGSDWDTYQNYTRQIRREYQIYPGWMYRKGRRKVLIHFLERSRLFFTSLYFEHYEFRARENLNRELKDLE